MKRKFTRRTIKDKKNFTELVLQMLIYRLASLNLLMIVIFTILSHKTVSNNLAQVVLYFTYSTLFRYFVPDRMKYF